MKLSQVLKFVKTSLNLVSREVWSYPTVKFSRPMVIVLAAFNCAVVSPVWVNDFCLCSQYTGNEKLKTRKQDLFDQNMNAVILTGETSPPKSKDKRWVFKACKINCRGKKCICLSFLIFSAKHSSHHATKRERLVYQAKSSIHSKSPFHYQFFLVMKLILVTVKTTRSYSMTHVLPSVIFQQCSTWQSTEMLRVIWDNFSATGQPS